MKELENIINTIPQRFNQKKAQTYTGVFHFVLTGTPKKFSIIIKDGSCHTQWDLTNQASCVFEMTCNDFIAMETGKLPIQEAFVHQKIKVDNLQEALNFSQFFTPFYKYFKEDKQQKTRKPKQGPLTGIRILDFSRLLPGPLATMMLADMGAEVIKIEHPDFPDYVRNYPPFIQGVSANYLALNRSKRSLLLDYQSEEGKKLFFDLVKTTDLIVEQFRPGVMDEWGIGYNSAKAINPKVSYISLTGYGQTGPFSQKAGHDLNYIAYSGVLSLNKDKHGRPLIPGVQMADIAAGAYMTVSACTTAIISQNKTGEGQHVDVSMLDGLMPLITLPFAQYQATGKAQNNHDLPLSGALANYQVYECADGKWIALGALEAKFWVNFCKLIGKFEWAELVSPEKISSPTLKKQVEAEFRKKTQKEWLILAEGQDVCLSPVSELDELERNLQLQDRKMIIMEEHPTIGNFKNIGLPIKFEGTPASPSWPAPELGEDTAAILNELKENE